MTVFKIVLLLLSAAIIAGCRKQDDSQPVGEQLTYNPTPVRITSGIPGLPEPLIPSDNPTTKEGIELGRLLFYDPNLSANGQISCASCHQLDKAFTDGLDVSIGINGQRTNRSAMALVNLAWVNRFFWDGRSVSLEEQSLHPIQESLEMANTLGNLVSTLSADTLYPKRFYAAFGTRAITPGLVAKALAQFERSIVSFNSKYDHYVLGTYSPTRDELDGFALFREHPYPPRLRGGNCGDCHTVGLFQGKMDGFAGFMNNGVQPAINDLGLFGLTANPNDSGKMRVPTLRNIALSAPYMHKGQLPTLEAVLDHYNSQDIMTRPSVDILIKGASNIYVPGGQAPSLGLTATEKAKIITFLNMLTDTSFVNNPAYKKPSLLKR